MPRLLSQWISALRSPSPSWTFFVSTLATMIGLTVLFSVIWAVVSAVTKGVTAHMPPRRERSEPGIGEAQRGARAGYGEQLRSVMHPTPSLINANRAILEIWGDNPGQRFPRSAIVETVLLEPLAPDVAVYFRRLPEGSYTKQELIDTLNAMVEERQREAAVGLFGIGYAEQEARRQIRR